MFFVILAVAGSETTRNALSQGLIALVDHAEQMEELRDRPELAATAAEEIIRWASPVLFFARIATCDTVLGGERIAGGDRVVLWYPSANRDERVFDDRSASTSTATRTRTCPSAVAVHPSAWAPTSPGRRCRC
jgi:cytochrome P450